MFVSKKARRFYVLMLCLFVFSFFVHAKLAAYSATSHLSGGPVHTASDAQKLDLNKAGKVILPLLLVLLVVTVRQRDDSAEFGPSRRLERPFLSHRFDPDRFLRPPPSSPVCSQYA